MIQHSQQTHNMQTWLNVLISLTIFITAGAFASESERQLSTYTMEPFSLTYEVSASNVPFKTEVNQRLEQQENGHFNFSMSAKAMFTKVEEKSTFKWEKPCQARTQRYTYLRKGIGRNKDRSIDFDWQKKQAAYRNNGKNGKKPISKMTTDKLSEQLAIQCEIAAGKTAFTIEIFDNDKIRSHDFEVVGKELVENPFFGDIEAYKVMRVNQKDDKRTTTFWIAPSLNYKLVRFLQEKKSGDHYQLLLKEIE